MAKAVKLPSGMWRARVLEYTDANKVKHYKSLTANTKKEAEYLAADYYANKRSKRGLNADITLSEAFEEYITSRSAVLSPTTIRAYYRMAHNQFLCLQDVKLSNLTNEQIQQAVNAESKKLAPKTVKSAYGLLKSVIKAYAPDLQVNVKLPQKKKKEIYIPTHDEIKTILKATNQTELGIAVLLAASLGMRLGEIVALNWNNVNFETNKIKISASAAKDKDNKLVIKPPKTLSGIRSVAMPDKVREELETWCKENKNEYVLNGLTSNAIYQRFVRHLKRNNIHHFRFHDLRHYNASVLLAMGVPDKYAQERLGHATNNMLKSVYQHIIEEKAKKVDSDFNDKFSDFF